MTGKPELVLPGGGFDGAIAAFDGGADAIYLGLSRFSARRQARNFDSLEYRKILKFARDQGKRIYVALNTLVLESEMALVSETLGFLSRFAPDAIIVQDWGLASLVRERYPTLPDRHKDPTGRSRSQACRNHAHSASP